MLAKCPAYYSNYYYFFFFKCSNSEKLKKKTKTALAVIVWHLFILSHLFGMDVCVDLLICECVAYSQGST